LELARTGLPLGLFLSLAPVVLGTMLHVRATYQPLNQAWVLSNGESYRMSWMYVLAMLITAVSCRIGAYLHRNAMPKLATVYFVGAMVAAVLGIDGLLSLIGVDAWSQRSVVLMLVPLATMIASRFSRGKAEEKPLALASHIAAGALIALESIAAVHLVPVYVLESAMGSTLHLWLAGFFAEAAVFYALAAGFQKHAASVVLAVAMACVALWQVLYYGDVSTECYTLTFASLGLASMVGLRFIRDKETNFAKAILVVANGLTSLSLVAAAFMTLSHLAVQPRDLHGTTAAFQFAMATISLLSAWLVPHEAWRRWYVVMTIVEAALAFAVLHLISQLTLWQKLEILSVIVGLALLVVGHIGCHREQNEQLSETVTFSLFNGSLLLAVPLTIAVLLNRFQAVPHFSTPNELGMFAAALLLLATGFVFRLRATTITGACTMMVYLLTLVMYVNALQNVKTAAIWMAIGGATIFATGIGLSIYRDRLLQLPEKIQRREGIFRVLNWR
jgi:hypothetical protein